jgi:YidC/Oxa1 family membrane protein insertase
MTSTLAHQFGNATLFGAKISDSFTSTHITGVRILAAVLVIAMTATTFTTQRQLMSKNMPADAMTGQYAQQQKMLLYVLPLVFAFGGIAFPIGVLFYWTTSNLWTMGQQFYVIRNNPAPGTPAAKAKEQRDAEKRERKGLTRALRGSGGSTDSSSGDPSDASADLAVPGSTAPTATPEPPAPRRQQPRKQSRSQRKRQPGRPPQPGRPGASGSTAASGGATSSERPDDEPGLNAS